MTQFIHVLSLQAPKLAEVTVAQSSEEQTPWQKGPTLGEEALWGIHALVAWLETEESCFPVFPGAACRALSEPVFPSL